MGVFLESCWILFESRKCSNCALLYLLLLYRVSLYKVLLYSILLYSSFLYSIILHTCITGHRHPEVCRVVWGEKEGGVVLGLEGVPPRAIHIAYLYCTT